MPTLADIPKVLIDYPSHDDLIRWLNYAPVTDPITRNQLLTLYSHATGIKFHAEDFARITTTS